MLVQKKTLTFNKEKNHWYLECKQWEDEQTELFRRTNYYEDKDGLIVKYSAVRDLTNPLDDHTKHPLWHDPHEDLIMADTFGKLLEKKANGKKTIQMDMASYGWVSNTFTHYDRMSYDASGARYVLRFDSELPKEIDLTPIFQYVFDGIIPQYLHLK